MIDQKEYMDFTEIYRKDYPDLQKKKRIQKWTRLFV